MVLQTIVLDIGAYSIKAGFSGNDLPLIDYPCCVGFRKRWLNCSKTRRLESTSTLTSSRDRGILELKYPITQRGYLDNREHMIYLLEQLLLYNNEHVLGNDFKTISDESSSLFVSTSITFQPPASLLDLFFDNFNISTIALGSQEGQALLASGRLTGLIFDLGETGIRSSAICDGYVFPSSIQKTYLHSGRELTEYLAHLIFQETSRMYGTSAEYEIIRHIKETMCYVVLNDFESKQKKHNRQRSYILPDGNIIQLGSCQYMCPETLFIGGSDGIQNILKTSLEASGIDTRKELYKNIVLCGGTSQLQGLRERLILELSKSCPASRGIMIKIILPKNPNYAPWIGGSILSSLNTTQWMTKNDYNEYGAQNLLALHNKKMMIHHQPTPLL